MGLFKRVEIVHPDPKYQHPEGWTAELEAEAEKAARKSWLKRCSTCGITMYTDAERCGEFGDGHPQ